MKAQQALVTKIQDGRYWYILFKLVFWNYFTLLFTQKAF